MTPGAGTTHNYSFDASGNLTTIPTGAAASYDKSGQLTSSTLSGTTTTYTYNADGQRLTAVQGTSTVASGTWNGAGQLSGYSDSPASMTAANYNGAGQRASTTITPNGGSAVTQDYVWNAAAGIPEMVMDGANAYIYAGALAPAEQVNLATGAVSYLVGDSLGSVRGVVNSAGSLTATTSYDAWGNPETTGGLISVTPFGYAGGYTDPTGLIYLINRYYDPGTGQFISVDPSVTQTLQPYGYANGNPISNTDPAGSRYRCTISNYCEDYPCNWWNGCSELSDSLPTILSLACDIWTAGILSWLCGAVANAVVLVGLYFIFRVTPFYWPTLLHIFKFGMIWGGITGLISAPAMRAVGHVFGNGLIKISEEVGGDSALVNAGRYILRKVSFQIGSHTRMNISGWIYKIFGV